VLAVFYFAMAPTHADTFSVLMDASCSNAL
jgi:hypothetical protein